MKVYKFGGASVNSAEGVKNLANIASSEPLPLFVIVSAMGKTTNSLERLTEAVVDGQRQQALEVFDQIKQYHNSIITELFDNCTHLDTVDTLFAELESIALGADSPIADVRYNLWYDHIVSYGEMLSTTIITRYLLHVGLSSYLVDMRKCMITDDRYRDANVNMVESSPLLMAQVEEHPNHIYIGQGFIGGTKKGETTTLGREGSDYSAAVVANILDAESVTIWKDVEGILNADPKLFDNTILIPELTYLDAIELAYSGAQIIHPKTIKPLQNKNIPLYVRSFSDISKRGSIIKGEMLGKVDLPILILKQNQVLISIRPKDFSFVLEDQMLPILSLFDAHGIKVGVIQSSAVNLSLCVDDARRLHEVIDILQRDFEVRYNQGMELLTIRGVTPELYTLHAERDDVFLIQKTRRMARIVRRKSK